MEVGHDVAVEGGQEAGGGCGDGGGAVVEEAGAVAVEGDDGADGVGEEAGRGFEASEEPDDVGHGEGVAGGGKGEGGREEEVDGGGGEGLEDLEPVDEVGDGRAVVCVERLEEDEGEAAHEGHADAVGLRGADVWLEAGDGLVVLLDGEYLEAVAGEAVGERLAGKAVELVCCAEGHDGVADGRVMRLLLRARVIADGLRGETIPEVGEGAQLGVGSDGAEVVREVAAHLAAVEVRGKWPHDAQRLAPLARLEELGLGQLGALDGVQRDARARG